MEKLIEGARMFAIGAHSAVGQFRRYTGESYWHHPRRVAEILVKHVPNAPKEWVAAAWLHDVLEDTQTHYQDLATQFGMTVADIVLEISDLDNKIGVRAERVNRYVQRLSWGSTATQTIKLADIIDNTSNIIEHDPKFAQVYVPERQQMLKVLAVKGDQTLYTLAKDLIQGYFDSKTQGGN